MIIRKYTIAASRIPGAGKGLFLEQPVRRGDVIVAPTEIRDAHLLDREALASLPGELLATSIRWFEDRYTIDPEWSDECYINHSFAPNGLWHLGFVFALGDLDAGSELTIDYRMLLGEGDTPGFRDALTGHEITGFSWEESLRLSAEQLQEVIGVPQGVPAFDA
jgi:hypothetical protein